jgi:hypothetical protein
MSGRHVPPVVSRMSVRVMMLLFFTAIGLLPIIGFIDSALNPRDKRQKQKLRPAALEIAARTVPSLLRRSSFRLRSPRLLRIRNRPGKRCNGRLVRLAP